MTVSAEILYEDIRKIIEERAFERLLGREEGQYVEVKGSAAYNLNRPDGKYELAKDISAFANSHGGFLIIGMTHKRLEDRKSDVIAGFDYVAENQIDRVLARQVINKHIYPKIENIEVEWRQHGTNSRQGVLFMHVPPQLPARKPYLMTKIIEEGEQIQGYVVGIVERNGDSNVPWNAAQVYQILRRGKSEEIDRLIAIESKIDRLTEQAVDATTPRAADLLEDRMKANEVGE